MNIGKEFYQSSNNLKDFFNSIGEDDIKVIDSYSDGTLLSFEVKKTETLMTELLKFVDDFEEYDSFCDRNFTREYYDSINLVGIHYLHSDYFGKYKELKYDNGRFCFTEDFVPKKFR